MPEGPSKPHGDPLSSPPKQKKRRSSREFDPERRYRRTHAPDLLKCPNCNQTLKGQFCSRCGQNNRVSRLYFGMLVKGFVQEAFELEGPLARTLVWLSTRPGVVCRDYIVGRRRRFMSPIRYFLLIALVSVAFVTIFDINQAEGFQKFSQDMQGANVSARVSEDSNMSEEERNAFQQAVERRLRDFVSPEGQREFSMEMQKKGPTIYLVLSPFFALGLMLLYIRKRMTYGEHLVFVLYTKAHLTLIVVLTALLGLHLTVIGGLMTMLLIPISYMTWAARDFYRESLLMAFIRQTIAHCFLILLSFLTGIFMAIYYVFVPAYLEFRDIQANPPAENGAEVSPADDGAAPVEESSTDDEPTSDEDTQAALVPTPAIDPLFRIDPAVLAGSPSVQR